MNETEETEKLKLEISALRNDVKALLKLQEDEKGVFEVLHAIGDAFSIMAYFTLLCLVGLALASFVSFYKENWIGIIVLILVGCFAYLSYQVKTKEF